MRLRIIALSLSLFAAARMPAMATECIQATSPAVTAPPVVAPVARQVATAVDATIDRDDVYSPINDKVIPRVEPLPAMVPPVDTLKQQIYNRMNAGLISGQLTTDEANDVRAMLDDVARQEASFKIESGGLTPGAMNNLMRKYQMINLALGDLLSNTNTNDYMGRFLLRRAGIQNRIHYDLAAGNLTPEEAEQLLAALNNVSDLYATAQATGETFSANEQEALHRDFSAIQAKLSERVGGKILFVAPPTHDKLAQFRSHIDQAIACKQVTPDEAAALISTYNQLVLAQAATVADEGVHSADLAMLAQKIDSLDFILTRQLQDRLQNGAIPKVAGSSNKL